MYDNPPPPILTHYMRSEIGVVTQPDKDRAYLEADFKKLNQIAKVPNMFYYNILQFDPDDHVMIFSCVGFLGFESQYGWIWSREKSLPREKIKKFKASLKQKGAIVKDFTKIDQSKCPSVRSVYPD